MQHFIVFIFFFSTFIIPARAQDTDNPVFHGAAGFVQGGLEFMSLENSRITPSLTAYDGAVYSGGSFGGGGMLLFRQGFMLEARGKAAFFSEPMFHQMWGGPRSVDQHTSVYSGVIAAGYALYNRKQWLVYPSLGIGWAGVKHDVTNISDTEIDYRSNTIPPGESIRMRLPQTLYDVKVSVLKLISLSGDNTRMPIGVDLGYSGSTGKKDWNPGEDVQGTAEFWYLKFKMGLGSFRR